jgi:hypothetical protein
VASVALITLGEAKEFLNITTATNDSELTSFIAAASQMWTSRGLPGGASAWDEWYDGGSARISLRHFPVLTVPLVTENVGPVAYTLTQVTLGSSSSAYSYTLDATTGLLVRRAAGVAVPFAAGVANVRVTYTTGITDTPEDIKHAIKLLTKHLWDTQRGGAKGLGGGADQPSTFTWPWRVDEIARAYYVPGIA